MPVTKAELAGFIKRYLTRLNQLASEFTQDNKLKIFPRFLVRPYEIIGIVSSDHGVGIEFVAEAASESVRIFEMDGNIENTVLPQKSTKNAAFSVKGRSCSIGGMSIFTKEFHEKHVERADGTVLVLSPPLDAFVRVEVSGDVIFHDVQFGSVIKNKPSVKTVRGALWIFGSNSTRDFGFKVAEERALEDFRRYLTLAGSGLPQFPQQGQLEVSLQSLSEGIKVFRNLIAKKTLEESELQDFFEKNPMFLCLATYKRLLPQLALERVDDTKLIPDFFLQRVTDDYWDILDIKLPQKPILAGSRDRRRFAAEVNDAIAQVRQYREYFEDPRNREKLRSEHGILVHKPKTMVLIGASSETDREELSRIRAQQPDVAIMAYDEILRQIDYLKGLLEKSQAPKSA